MFGSPEIGFDILFYYTAKGAIKQEKSLFFRSARAQKNRRGNP